MEDKRCEWCGKTITQRDNEDTWAYTKRKYCGLGCANEHSGFRRHIKSKYAKRSRTKVWK